ncbi:MAG TPA: peptidylprolyl isomerase [Hyphomonas sp.]|nr:peptidylprolyl isomerase [Hyphomonas sp.]HAO35418.1 peptidylprolyl isomerase [Hyphomonas sp.]HAW56851.1 peptidylprolyl isomerase [Hyphomonas sp.]HBJ39658.1 peptidylprolyl isomerase [Hyphomonas sp.]HBN94442.1 peptidylprolyl isomerase [Hyphomonas sp.]
MVRISLMAVAIGISLLGACETAPDPSPAPASEMVDAPAPVAPWREVAPENLVVLKTVTGDVMIELAPEAAPKHVAQFREAIRSNLYNGEYFYRVIDGHVAQAGLEFEHLLEDWAELPLEAERAVDADGFVPLGNEDLFAGQVGHRNGFAVGRESGQEWLLHCPGALGMARNSPPETGSTEFFVPIGQRRYLDRNYTIFGRVISGMAHINRLERVEPVQEDKIESFQNPDTSEKAFAARAQALSANEILSVGLAADMPESLRPRWEVMATPGAEWEDLKTSKRDYSIYDAFVVTPPKRVDICTLPVPARQVLVD